MEKLISFRAASANAEKFPELTFSSVKAFEENLLWLLEQTGYQLVTTDISFFFEERDLEHVHNVFYKYGSDKAHHTYHILYNFILHRLPTESPNVLEIGIGTNNPDLVSTMFTDGHPGASLRAWRDLIPQSSVFGADIDRNILFQEEGIETFYVDQLNLSSFDALKNEKGYDLIVDDGLHSVGANLNTLQFALKSLNVNGWIVIEDIKYGPELWGVVDFLLTRDGRYITYFVKAVSTYLYVVHRVS